MNKIAAFEYLVSRLLEWYNEKSHQSTDNDISVLKALKLLFLVSAVDTYKNSTDTLLDNPFNNFVAMPYGHVESDVYSAIKNNALRNIEINNHSTTILDSTSVNLLEPACKEKIDVSIQKLKKINTDLISLSSFDLVELSHSWYSWQKNYQLARNTGAFSYPIAIEEIKNENKFYQL